MMDADCPDPARWVDLAEAPESPGREPLLRHAEACEGGALELAAALAARQCRETGEPPLPAPVHARALAAFRPRTPRRWRPIAAAAALLATAEAWILIREPLPREEAPASPPSRTEAAAGPNPFQDGQSPAGIDLILGAGRSGTLVLRAGSRTVREPGEPLRLVSGALELTARGEPCELAFSRTRISVETGELILEARKEPAASSAGWPLLTEALGAVEEAPGARLSVLAGSAVLAAGGRRLTLEAGQAAFLTGDALPEARTSDFTGPAVWREGKSLPRRFRDQTVDLAPGFGKKPLDDYAWEAVLTRTTPATAVILRFPAGRGWELPLGFNLTGEPGTPFRVGVEVRRGWVRLEVGGREIAACSVSELAGQVQKSDGSVPGLRIWGGDAEILSARWRSRP